MKRIWCEFLLWRADCLHEKANRYLGLADDCRTRAKEMAKRAVKGGSATGNYK